MVDGVPQIPSLNRNTEPWIGRVPGLGSVLVRADGSFEVQVESAEDEDIRLREDALRYGWAELLASVRKGHSHAGGMTWGHPDAERCLLITGEGRDVSRLFGPLLDHSLVVIADRPSPLSWQDGVLMAQPSMRPVVLGRGRAQQIGYDWTPLRAESDAGRANLPRLHEPKPVGGMLLVHPRRPDEDLFTLVTGHDKMEVAANAMQRGILDPDYPTELASEADEAVTKLVLARHQRNLAFARLPFAKARIDPDAVDATFAAASAWIDEVLGW